MLGNAKGREKYIAYTLGMLLFILLVMFMYLIVFVKLEGIDAKGNRSFDNLVFVKDDVLLTSSDGWQARVNLPLKLAKDEEYSYSFIPQYAVEGEKLFLYIKGSYHVFKLRYKDELIYQNDSMDTRFIKSGGDYVRLIRIPDKYIGKEITISFKALTTSNYGIRIPFIILGTHGDLVLYSYIQDLDILIIAAILLVFSIESSIVQFVLLFFKKAHMRSFLVSLYALVLGLYIAVRTPALYYIWPKGPFLYVLDYLLFMILPLSVALFILIIAKKEASHKISHKLIQILLSIFIINLIIQIVLTFSGYTEFMEMQTISQIAVVSVALIALIIPYTLETFEYKRIISVAMVALMIILLSLLSVYLSTYRIRYMTILGLVGGLFIVFQGLVVMKIYSKTYAIKYKVGLNKRLAFTDNLTRISNRNAFEIDIKNLDKRNQKMMFMIIDINNLKEINDKYGHSAGDYIIKGVAALLNKCAISFNKLKPYRIGGDEFVMIALDVDYNYAQNAVDYLNSQAAEFKNKEHVIPMNFGMAYELTTLSEDFNIDEFMREVDKKMYEDKKFKKRDFSV